MMAIPDKIMKLNDAEPYSLINFGTVFLCHCHEDGEKEAAAPIGGSPIGVQQNMGCSKIG